MTSATMILSPAGGGTRTAVCTPRQSGVGHGYVEPRSGLAQSAHAACAQVAPIVTILPPSSRRTRCTPRAFPHTRDTPAGCTVRNERLQAPWTIDLRRSCRQAPRPMCSAAVETASAPQDSSPEHPSPFRYKSKGQTPILDKTQWRTQLSHKAAFSPRWQGLAARPAAANA